MLTNTKTWTRPTIAVVVAGIALGLCPGPATAASATGSKQAAAAFAQVVPATQVPLGRLYIPPWTGGGDREFAGHGPDVQVDAALELVPIQRKTSIDLRLHMRAVETTADWTRAEGSMRARIYNAPVGSCIVSVSVLTSDAYFYRDTDTALDVLHPLNVRSLVSRYEVVGDSSGDDAGVRTGVTVFTKAFIVNLQAC